ncbi:hypothetical protein AQPW35_28570 [Rubrivivax pictus]|uniref:Uncharacterized protein n=2 Tax=Pseudaquabacterium pictum TaxID=2315236 RepID=A0A480AS59_9BURK|nr:hypothetical protein AQPW35_28570 [Rubrivivax pictus]
MPGMHAMDDFLNAEGLRAALGPATGCDHCAGLQCAGWESVTAPLGAPLLQPLGTLRDPAIDEPTYLERHAEGTSFWHARAPVALTHFPYNRCTVWRCPQCRRGFLQYTEAGGYYVDHRVRAIDPALIEA